MSQVFRGVHSLDLCFLFGQQLRLVSFASQLVLILHGLSLELLLLCHGILVALAILLLHGCVLFQLLLVSPLCELIVEHALLLRGL